MRRILGTCGIAFCAAIAAAAESPESLVQKLGSPRYADREAAGKELLARGVEALAAVKAAAETSSDPEIRERAAALLEPLARRNDSSRLLAAKPIRIEWKAVPLASAIAEFKAKTGIPLTLLPGKVADANRPVTVPAGEYAPWEALEVLLKAAGLREENCVELPGGLKVGSPNSPYVNRRQFMEDEMIGGGMIYTPTTAPILLVDGASENLPATRSGGVRVTTLPAAFAANRVIRGAGRVMFHLDAAPLPSTGWHGSSGVRINIAEDEDGRPVFADLKLPHDNVNANPYEAWNFVGGFGRRRAVFWGGGGMAWIDDGNGNSPSPNANPRLVPVAIRTNDRAVKTLRRFEGAVLGEVHTPNVPILTIENLEKAAGTTYPGPQQSNLAIQEIKKQKDGSHIVKIRHESLTIWAMQQMRGIQWNGSINDNPAEILGRMKFYDAAGKLLATPQQEGTNYSGDGFRQTLEATLRFPKNSAAPARLIVTGTKITTVEVPFKLVNVPVP